MTLATADLMLTLHISVRSNPNLRSIQSVRHQIVRAITVLTNEPLSVKGSGGRHPFACCGLGERPSR